MKRKAASIFFVSIVCAVCFAVISSSYSQELPVAAMNMLAEAKTETCVICQEKLRKKAFAILEKELPPGKALTFSDANSLVLKQGYGAHLLEPRNSGTTNSNNEDMENRPGVSFRFHTDRNHLTGISRDDYTGRVMAEKLRTTRKGVTLHGTLQLVEFKYGDGACFNFFQKQNEIIIHCKILSLD